MPRPSPEPRSRAKFPGEARRATSLFFEHGHALPQGHHRLPQGHAPAGTADRHNAVIAFFVVDRRSRAYLPDEEALEPVESVEEEHRTDRE